MAITFYYGAGSPFAWRVWLALEHKALAYDIKVLSFSEADLKKPDLDVRAALPQPLRGLDAAHRRAAVFFQDLASPLEIAHATQILRQDLPPR